MKVPYLELRPSYLELKSEIDSSIMRVLNSGRYIFGDEVTSFEDQWADYCNAKFAVGVGNGFDALYHTLKILDIGKGDEVIVPSHTFIATWLAVSNTGAKPIGIPPNTDTYNIDVNKIEEKINEKTKAIIPVHLYGCPADLDQIQQISKKYNLFVIEDAAQAHGAMYKSSKIGTHSDAVCWSFYPGKNLGAYGDAGAVTTNNSNIYDKLKLSINYGSKEKYHHQSNGLNSRLDPIQAAILKIKMKYLDEWNLRRRSIAKVYQQHLKYTGLKFQEVELNTEPVWHTFTIRHRLRNKIQEYLEKRNIETQIHYPIPICEQNVYYSKVPICQTSVNLSRTLLSLPIGPHLCSKSVEYVSSTLLEFLENA